MKASFQNEASGKLSRRQVSTYLYGLISYINEMYAKLRVIMNLGYRSRRDVRKTRQSMRATSLVINLAQRLVDPFEVQTTKGLVWKTLNE